MLFLRNKESSIALCSSIQHTEDWDLESWEAWSVLHTEPILTNTAAVTKMSLSVIPVSL